MSTFCYNVATGSFCILITNTNTILLGVNFSMLTIPHNSIKRLGDVIMKHGKLSHIKEGNEVVRNLPDGEPLFIYLIKGQVRYELSENYWLSSVKSPAVLGVIDYFYPNEGVGKFISETDTLVYSVSANKIVSHLSEEKSWPDIAIFLSYVIKMLISRESFLVSSNAYAIVCHYLNTLNKECSEVKRKISALHYLHRHTKLSKSMISLIISELKKGGYITIDRGFLVSINFLPENF